MNKLKKLKKLIKSNTPIIYRVELIDGWGTYREIITEGTDLQQVLNTWNRCPENTLFDGPHYSFYYWYIDSKGKRSGGSLTTTEAEELIRYSNNV